jgi:uncharacterized protein YbaR (Trm112 family)
MKHVSDNLLKLLKCPACADGSLKDIDGLRLTCLACGRSYPIVDGIPDLLPEIGALPAAVAEQAPAGE